MPIPPPPTYAICYDINMSPYAGGEDLLFASRLVEQWETYLISKTSIPHSRSIWARAFRLGELFAVYLPLNSFTSVVQHEIFGHGYRVRDINHGIASVRGYEFDLPIPYGPGGATTFFSIDPHKITSTDLTCISMAGVEAQAILGLQTKFKWLESNSIDPKQAVLYLFSQYAINLYASPEDFENDSHDLASYVNTLNLTYTASKLTVDRIQALAWINLADPFTYYSVASWFYYIFSGNPISIPMISIKDYKYLLGAHLGLTPFGPEYFFDNFLLKGNSPIYFYAKGGCHAKNTYFGFGCLIPNLFVFNQWAFGLRLDSWKQPKLLLHQGQIPLYTLDLREPPDKENPIYSSHDQHADHFGLASSLIASYRMNRAFGLQMELGYKSAGFLPGYSIYPSPVVRVSYLASF